MPLPRHILMGSTLPNLVRTIARNRSSIQHWDKVLGSLGVSALLAPARLVERLATERAVRATRIEDPPVFVLGHWRSGTTHLHNLMTRDERFGYVSTQQGLFPYMCATSAAVGRVLLRLGGPSTRPMDEMAFAADLPWEEEPCIANVCASSGLNAWYFPDRASEYFDRYVTFATASERDIWSWQRACLWTLQKASYLSGGRRLVAKNPWSTARIPQLLQLFPDAVFVHIHRNPYEVFASSLHGFRTGVRLLAMREATEDGARRFILRSYTELMSRFLEHRTLVPDGRLVEVSYDDLQAGPVGVLKRIYGDLSLARFEDALPSVKSYLGSVAGYRKNRHTYDAADVALVSREWAFAIERWGYRPPAA